MVAGSWYGREIHRMTLDLYLHGRSSLRRVAEFWRALIGHQARWQQWFVWEEGGTDRAPCRLAGSTVQRWHDRAGQVARCGVKGQLAGIVSSGRMATDGLWARLRGGIQRVVLALRDSVSGLLWPPVVALEEESAAAWRAMFSRAQEAGLEIQALLGLTSDGAQGLLAFLREGLPWVNQQRCQWHMWRSLAGDLARAVAQGTKGLAGQAKKQAAESLRQELTAFLHGVMDASGYEQAEQALAALRAHAFGAGLWRKLNEQLDRLFVYRSDAYRGVCRVSPEWMWRDFRMRLSHGRNHGSDQRLERAALVWQIYHNFTPAQRRSEHKRHYRHPGQSALEVAGAPPGQLSYLDALGV